VEGMIQYLQSLDPWLVYTVVFAIAFVENIFPPSPSDLVVVFGGSLVGIGRVGFVEMLAATTAGSTLGFMTMYMVGEWFGARILERGRIKFIPAAAVRKVDDWFRRYGYWIIIANRFLSGTRAVVSFFAGMAHLKLVRTTVLSFLSALAWNTVLVSGGYVLGQNWERIGFYLSAYSQIVTGIVVVVVLILTARYLYIKQKRKSSL
jgi:membrane protein DedA with SNARE-associated domain